VSRLFHKEPSRREIAIFTRQLATLVKSGITLRKAMEVLEHQYVGDSLGPSIRSIGRAMDGGSSLSRAFGQETAIFGSMYLALLAAGEEYGSFDSCLGQLATYLEREANLREKVKAALIYPAFVLSVTLILTYFVFSSVLPPFLPIFHSLKDGIPLPTRFLMLLVAASRNPLLMLGLGALTGGAILWVKRFLKGPTGQELVSHAILSIPVAGELARKVELARLARAVGTLTSSGAAVMDSLLQASRICGSIVYKNSVSRAREYIRAGGSLSEYFRKSALYPALFTQMVAAGESSGKLDEYMMRAAEMYDRDLEHSLEIFIGLLEPLLLTILAMIVGFIVISVFLPLYSFLIHF